MMTGCEMGWGSMVGMMAIGLVGVLLVVAAISGLLYLILRFVVRAMHAGRADAALVELRTAFARGDVDVDEYDARRAVLQRDGQ